MELVYFVNDKSKLKLTYKQPKATVFGGGLYTETGDLRPSWESMNLETLLVFDMIQNHPYFVLEKCMYVIGEK